MKLEPFLFARTVETFGLHQERSHQVRGDVGSTASTSDVALTPREMNGRSLNIRLLKIDAQGHELQILRGAENLFYHRFVKLVMFELWPAGLYQNYATARELLDFFLDHDYGLLYIPNAASTGATYSNSGPRALDPFWLRSARCMGEGYSYVTMYALRDVQLSRWQQRWRSQTLCADEKKES